MLVEDHRTSRIPTADRAEAALIAGAGDQLAQNIIHGVSLRAAFVNRVDDDVGGRQRREWKYLGHGSKADFRTKPVERMCGARPVRTCCRRRTCCGRSGEHTSELQSL